jgi:hypothetical protein
MRRLRAVMIIALFWGVLWFLVGIPIRALIEPLLHADFEPPPPFLALPTILMVWGAVSGAVFAVFLLAAERRRSLQTLSWRRVLIWGSLGPLVLPIVDVLLEGIGPGSALWVPMLVISAIGATLGGACAAATLALAMRVKSNSAAPAA